jgi:hypothetical protein
MNRLGFVFPLASTLLLVAACKGGTGGTGGTGGSELPPPDCSAGCPGGYTCDDGVCTGGNPQALDFDVKTFPVSGKLTVDGAPPLGNGCSGDQVRIGFLSGPKPEHFWDPVLGDDIVAGIDCATSDGSFSAQVPAGTYRVVAYQYDGSSTFPNATFLIDPEYTVSGPLPALAWKLTTVALSGKIKVDGQAPQGNGCSGDQVRLGFLDDRGAVFTGGIDCAASDGSFTARVAPGTYKVSVYQYDGSSTFPNATFVADPAYDVSAAKAGIAWNLKTVALGGKIKVDGQAPQGNGCSGDQVRIDFVNGDGSRFTGGVDCGASDGSFTARVSPGTYQVQIYQYDGSSTFPNATFVADPEYTVSTANPAIAWNLKTVALGGKIKVDGQAPQGNGCSGDQVRIDFVNADGSRFTGGVDCGASDGSFTARVSPGTYQAQVYQYDGSSTFPNATFVADPAFAVTAANPGIAWNLKTVPLGGKLLVDGQAPQGNGCSGDQVRIHIFDDAGARFTAGVDCAASDGTWSGVAAPGTYRFVATQYDGSSTFPNATFKLQDAILIQ